MPKKEGYGRFVENFPGADVTADEWEFLKAMRHYQTFHGRRYPTWREVLNVLKALGYRKVAAETALPKPPRGHRKKKLPNAPPAPTRSRTEEDSPCR